MNRIAVYVAGLLLSAGLTLSAQGVMHCFVYTPVESASDAEWQAFYKATDALPQKIKGLKQVWYGKLMRPLAQYNVTDAEARKKIQSEGKGTGDVSFARRQHGVCMLFADEAAFKAYAADPAHKEWESVYGKVRVPGTTTFQIVTQ